MNIKEILQQYQSAERKLKKALKELGVGVTFENRAYVYDSKEKAIRSYLLGQQPVVQPVEEVSEPESEKPVVEEKPKAEEPKPEVEEKPKSAKEKAKEEFMRMAKQETVQPKQLKFDDEGYLEQEEPDEIPMSLPPLEMTLKKNPAFMRGSADEARKILGL